MSEDVSSKVKKIVADHLGIDEAKVAEEKAQAEAAEKAATVEAQKKLLKKLNRTNKRKLLKVHYQAQKDSLVISRKESMISMKI